MPARPRQPRPAPAARDTADAYTYLRYSSGKQEAGDTARRQTDGFDRWFQANPRVRFFKNLEDRGVSAFDARHLFERGASDLADFGFDVREGRVEPGTYLVLESLDRMSRAEEWAAMEFFSGIIRRGVKVVRLVPNWRTFDTQSGIQGLLESAVDFSRSHGESVMKSDRLGATWGEKKRLARDGLPHGGAVPAWLELVGVQPGTGGRKDYSQARYRIRPGAKAVFRRVYTLAADEGLSVSALRARLEAEGVKPIGRSGRWTRTYLHEMLSSRAAIGEYQPCIGRNETRAPDGDPIPGYYPKAVDEALWARVQATRRTMPEKRRAPRAAGCPLAGLVVDARDGEPMYLNFREAKPGAPRKRLARFYSSAAADRRPGASAASYSERVLTEALLSQMRELKADELFSAPGASKVAEIDAKLQEYRRRLDGADEMWKAEPESRRWRENVSKYDALVRAAEAELREAQREDANKLPAAWVEAVGLMARDEPARLAAALRRTVEEVRLLVVEPGDKWGPKPAAAQVFFKGGAVRSYVILWNRRHKSVPEEDHVPWEVRSFVGPVTTIDLRDPKNLPDVETILVPHHGAGS